MLYGLLCGFLPFDVDHEDETHLLYQKIKVSKFVIISLESSNDLDLFYITSSFCISTR